MPRETFQRDRSPLLWLVLPFALGIGISHTTGFDHAAPAGATIALVALAIGTWAISGHPHIWGSCLLVALTGAGAIHHTWQRNELPEWSKLPQREAELTVSIIRVFPADPVATHQGFLGRVQTAAYPTGELKGQRLHVQLRRPRETSATLLRGGVIRIIGKLEQLSVDQLEDGFQRYLYDSGHNFRLRQARWLETVTAPSRYAQYRTRLKARGVAVLSAGLEHHPQLAAALCAMLLGERHQLSESDRTLFLRSGTMHLFAISGLHIGIIAAIINSTLRLLRLPRSLAYIMGSVLLLGYVDLIGLTPSAVRAWLMITCFLVGRIGQAPGNPVAAIAASALIVLLISPLQLFSPGFQMSYAIVFALLLHGMPLGTELNQRWQPWRHLPRASLHPLQRWLQHRTKIIVATTALTWSASLIGVISGVGIFGWFAPGAFFANLILVPLAGFVITAGCISLGFGLMGISTIALLFNHAAAMILGSMFWILEQGLHPLAGVSASFHRPWWGEFGIVAVFVTMVAVNEMKSGSTSWRWSAPTIVTMLVLVTGLHFG